MTARNYHVEIRDHDVAYAVKSGYGWLARFWYEDNPDEELWFWFKTKKAALASVDPKGERVELWRLEAVKLSR